MKKGNYLKFYKDCCKNRNIMPDAGLCLVSSFNKHHFKKFIPTEDECIKHEIRVSWFGVHYTYWGGPHFDFNDLRQNIVLFLAAMNNEL